MENFPKDILSNEPFKLKLDRRPSIISENRRNSIISPTLLLRRESIARRESITRRESIARRESITHGLPSTRRMSKLDKLDIELCEKLELFNKEDKIFIEYQELEKKQLMHPEGSLLFSNFNQLSLLKNHPCIQKVPYCFLTLIR
jgi:hypothetical protein